MGIVELAIMTFIGKLLDESHSFLSGLQVKESGD